MYLLSYSKYFFDLNLESIQNLSKLAYKKNFLLDKHDANIISVNQRVDKLNYLNDLEKNLMNKKYSSRMIELRNNNNFSKSIINSNNRIIIMERYFEK